MNRLVALRGGVLEADDLGRSLSECRREAVSAIRFDQSERDMREGERGMGIGLSIGRTIILRNGGRIWTEPNPDGGILGNSCYRYPLKTHAFRRPCGTKASSCRCWNVWTTSSVDRGSLKEDRLTSANGTELAI